MTEGPSTLRPIRAYLDDALRSTAEEFVAKHASAVLVFEPFTPEESVRLLTTRKGAHRGAEPGVVVELAKRPGANAFSSMITIGRAPNNDVVVPASEVSKFHAYVAVHERATVLVDVGSTNGTLVVGRPVRPRLERAELTDGAEVLFGTLRAVYYTSRGFYSALRSGDVTSPRASSAPRTSP